MHQKMKGVDPDANYRLRQPVKERGEEDREKGKPREEMEKEANWRRRRRDGGNTENQSQTGWR